MLSDFHHFRKFNTPPFASTSFLDLRCPNMTPTLLILLALAITSSTRNVLRTSCFLHQQSPPSSSSGGGCQNQQNQQALMLNRQLAAEVRDLKEGLEMVEEKARMELGMVKPNEILVQIAKPSSSAPATR